MERRRSSFHYHTFPTQPPPSRGASPENAFLARTLSSRSTDLFGDDESNGSKISVAGTGSNAKANDGGNGRTPIPKRQLFILAIISLAEQTALNSISPYLPEMTGNFPGVDQQRVGLYVGIVASSFAGAQFATNFFWGRLSDRVGRKPVILFGTLATAACFVAFGFCRTLWQAIVVQAVIGAVNGNAGIVPTVLGEITNKSNQSSSFKYLPVLYGVGGITGPLIGGVLAQPVAGTPNGPISKMFAGYPYLLPNVVSAFILFLGLLSAVFFLDESLKEAKELEPLGARVKSLFIWLWEFTSSARPSYIRVPQRHDDGPEMEEQDGSPRDPSGDSGSFSLPTFLPEAPIHLSYRSLLTAPTITFLLTYAIFSLSNASYNSLYPIYVSSPPPTGRGLSPRDIGLSLSFVGIATISLQLILFGPLQTRLGNLRVYRFAIGAVMVAFWLMPFVGYVDPKNRESSKALLWIELCSILLLKTVASVIGLTCAMLLTTNASPKDSTLGTLNGLAQTLNAGGRAVGPLLSGGLFTVSTRLRPKGELLAWGVFGGVAGIGLGLSLWGVGGRRFADEEGGTGVGGEDRGEGGR